MARKYSEKNAEASRKNLEKARAVAKATGRTGGRPKGSYGPKKIMALALAAVEEGTAISPAEFFNRVMNAPMPPELVELVRKAYGTTDVGELTDLLPSLISSLTDWYSLRNDAAKAWAPYKHARLSATQVTGKDGEPVKVEIIKP